MRLQPGARLGPYEIVAPLGAGGMGEVYRAKDARLDRKVAIKIISAAVDDRPEVRQRFEREARAVSSLSHPHICPLFDVGEAILAGMGTDVPRSVPFLVMEFLDGQTMAARLRQGPLPIDQVLRHAIEIASALDAAHRQGIVHRDLKPGNIMLTKAGAKLLDFGLAKAASTRVGAQASAVGADLVLPTAVPTQPGPLTSEGTILGTFNYMAPEQLEGKEADARSDLFAFGAVVYEMATGRKAFDGATPATVIAAILEREPEPLSQLQPVVPPAFDHLVTRCLQKDPDERWQTARDLVAELKWLQDTRPGPPITSAAPIVAVRRQQRATIVATTVALVIGTVAGVGIDRRWHSTVEDQRTEPALQQLTANPAELPVYGAAISLDAKYLAYTDANGLFLRVIDTGETHPVPVPEGWRFWDVSWFPDGTKLLVTGPSASRETMSLYSVATFGGTPRKLQDDAWRAAVSPDGSAIVFIRASFPIRDVWLMGSGGENPRRVVAGKPDETFWQVGWSPDSRRIVYGRLSKAGNVLQPDDAIAIETRDREGQKTSVIVAGLRLFQNWRGILPFSWLPDGRFIFALREAPPNEDGSNLWETRIDGQTATGSPPRRVTQLGNYNIRDLRATADGHRLTFLRERNQADVYVAAFDSAHVRLSAPTRLTLDDRDDQPQSWTPDAKQIVFESRRAGSWDVFRQRIDAMTAEPLVITPGKDDAPRVSPDGVWVLYRHDRRLMRVPLAGGPAELVLEGRGPIAADCAPSTRCVMSELAGNELTFSEVHPLRGRGRELRRVDTASSDFTNWRLSSDGNRVAMVDFGNRVRLFDLAGGTPRDLAIASWTAFECVAWAADGRGVFVPGLSLRDPPLSNTGFLHVDLDGRVHVLRHEQNEWQVWPVASPDGKSVAFGAMKLESNVWMIEKF